MRRKGNEPIGMETLKHDRRLQLYWPRMGGPKPTNARIYQIPHMSATPACAKYVSSGSHVPLVHVFFVPCQMFSTPVYRYRQGGT